MTKLLIALRKKPYYLFLVAAVVYLMISTFKTDADGLDIHLHDTYFVISSQVFAAIVAFILVLHWLVYYWLYRLMYSRWLAWIHILVTSVFFLLFFMPNYSEPVIGGAPRRYNDYNAWESFHSFEGFNGFISIVVIVVFFTQLLFLLNILLGIFRNFSRRT